MFSPQIHLHNKQKRSPKKGVLQQTNKKVLIKTMISQRKFYKQKNPFTNKNVFSAENQQKNMFSPTNKFPHQKISPKTNYNQKKFPKKNVSEKISVHKKKSFHQERVYAKIYFKQNIFSHTNST